MPAIKLVEHHRQQHRHISHENGLAFNIRGFDGNNNANTQGCFLTHGGSQFYASLQSEDRQLFVAQVSLVFSTGDAGKVNASVVMTRPGDQSSIMAFSGPVNPPEMLGDKRLREMSRLAFTRQHVQQFGVNGKVDVSFKVGAMMQQQGQVREKDQDACSVAPFQPL